MAAVLVLCRLCPPSSELCIAERRCNRAALADLLGVLAGIINEDRLYRARDRVLFPKGALQTFPRNWPGSLFDLEYDLQVYDMTSTYFEGPGQRLPQGPAGIQPRPPG